MSDGEQGRAELAALNALQRRIRIRRYDEFPRSNNLAGACTGRSVDNAVYVSSRAAMETTCDDSHLKTPFGGFDQLVLIHAMNVLLGGLVDDMTEFIGYIRDRNAMEKHP